MVIEPWPQEHPVYLHRLAFFTFSPKRYQGSLMSAPFAIEAFSAQALQVRITERLDRQ